MSPICRPALAAFKAALLTMTLSGPCDVLAGERAAWRDDPLGSRFVFGAGLYGPRLDTKFRVDSSTGRVGTEIDFESTPGMDDNDLFGELEYKYRGPALTIAAYF